MRRVLVITAILATGAMLVAPLACRQIAGIQSDPITDLTTTVCGLPYGTNTCAACASTNCCAESNACAADQACDAYQTCIGKCSGEPQCRAQCMIADPGVVTDVSVLDACLASNCAAPCGLACGGSVVERLTPPDASAPCDTCVQNQNACDAAHACASSVDCDEYARCFVACPTPDCRQACAAQHDAGAALFGPVQEVYATSCSADCAYGQNWNCVGHVVYPATTVSAITQSFTLFDYGGQSPAVGVDLCLSAVCSTCGVSGPFAKGVTDDAGFASLRVALPPIGALGGTPPGFQGCLAFSSPSIVPAWGEDGFSQTQAALTFPASYAGVTLTPAEVTTGLKTVGLAWDPSRAIVAARVLDCLGTPAPNTQVTFDTQDPQTMLWYVGTPEPVSATATNSTIATGNSGDVAIVNVPAPAADAGAGRNVTLTARPVHLGMISSRVVAPVQAGIYTEVTMPPTPVP